MLNRFVCRNSPKRSADTLNPLVSSTTPFLVLFCATFVAQSRFSLLRENRSLIELEPLVAQGPGGVVERRAVDVYDYWRPSETAAWVFCATFVIFMGLTCGVRVRVAKSESELRRCSAQAVGLPLGRLCFSDGASSSGEKVHFGSKSCISTIRPKLGGAYEASR